MAGIYIHIPFCKSKCVYCNFYSVASSAHIDDFIKSVLKEIALQKDYLENEKIETIYFGGGTPSLLPEGAVKKILDKIHSIFGLISDLEITLEANPDDVSDKNLKEWKHASVNRLSIGAQSFSDTDLAFLKRKHNASLSEAAIKRSQDAGFENINADLIYGIPGQKEETWRENIYRTIGLLVPHISAYCLAAEEKTVLYKKICSEKIQPLNEEQSALHFRILMNEMKKNNFLHYEISNFCKEGFLSKHNTSYWKSAKYLGLGPSAHSYNGESRQWNIANLAEYLKNISENKIPSEKEMLTQTDKINEYIMTSLRTMWGCDLSFIEKVYGTEEKIRILQLSNPFLKKDYIKIDNNVIFLTDEGKLFADKIASDLFIIN